MQSLDNNTQAFLALVSAGLWAEAGFTESWNQVFADSIDWEEVYRLASEQSVVGIVLAGLESLKKANVNLSLNQEMLLQMIGEVQMMEQTNKAMNGFIRKLVDKMRMASIYTLLVKGQGVAQCYERPLWRSCGDVDLLLSDDNYQKAKEFLVPLASSVKTGGGPHLGLTIDNWIVELHGNLSCGLSEKMDRVINDVQCDVFCGGDVRSWMNGNTQVFLPGIDSDVVFIFTHFLKHFYKGGLGLRQICDWCRLLWTYRESLNRELLESRIREMGLMSEWKAFSAFAVDFLGMSSEAMPLYSSARKWSHKAKRIQEFVMRVGNFGHNRDNYHNGSSPFIIRKCISFSRRVVDVFNHTMIFPMDSLRFFLNMVFNGVRLAAKGIG